MRIFVLLSLCLACLGDGSRVHKARKRTQGSSEGEHLDLHRGMPGDAHNPLKTLAMLLKRSGSEKPAVGWQLTGQSQNFIANNRVALSGSPSAWVPTRRTVGADLTKLQGGWRRSSQRSTGVVAQASDTAPTAPPQQADEAPELEPGTPFPVPSQPIPVTLLSGFLGTGKTTLLRHILQNTEGVRVGVIVNDVAAVNIDSKLVKSESSQNILAGDTEDMIELSNGCACCSAGDDFFGALAMLVTSAMTRGITYDYIVFEASGVAEPKLLRRMFQEAQMQEWPIMKYLKLESMVTVVDSANFLELYNSTDSTANREDLGADPGIFLDEEMTINVKEKTAPSVVQLLIEQIETADVLVLNKIDSVDETDLNYLKEILGVINGFADVTTTTFGQVPPMSLLKKNRDAAVAMSNEIMDHGSAVDFASWLESQPDKNKALIQPREMEHEHEHEHAHEKAEHDHEHEHEHKHSHAEKTDHELEHEHGHADAKSHSHSHQEHSHDHSHSHEHSHGGECDDPDCTDPSHSHDDRQETTAAVRFGIKTFVYSQRRPFATERFEALLKTLPFARLKKYTPRALQEPTDEDNGEAGRDGPFAPVMRSKGFVWLTTENVAALYWSQAGRQIEVTEMGRWWASLERSQWPAAHIQAIMQDCKGQYGDRRQELVFIGSNLDKEAIISALDACLATDEEMREMESEAEKAGIPMKIASYIS